MVCGTWPKKVQPKKRSKRAQNIDDDKTDGNEKRKQKDLRLRMFKLKETHYNFTLFYLFLAFSWGQNPS